MILTKPALSCKGTKPSVVSQQVARPCRVLRRLQASPQEDAAPSSSAPEGKILREFKSLGSKVIESNEPFEDPSTMKDSWEGEQFEMVGQVLERWFLPGLVVLGLVCGGIAASSYNEGADTYIKSNFAAATMSECSVPEFAFE